MYLELHHPTSSMATFEDNENNSVKRYSFKNWFQTSMTLAYSKWVVLKLCFHISLTLFSFLISFKVIVIVRLLIKIQSFRKCSTSGSCIFISFFLESLPHKSNPFLFIKINQKYHFVRF